MGFIGKICCYITAFVVLGYLVPHFIVSFLPKQDLKKKVRALSERAGRISRALYDGRVHFSCWHPIALAAALRAWLYLIRELTARSA